MITHLKELYHQFIGEKIDNDSFNEFKESVNKASDDELWDIMLDEYKESKHNIAMPQAVKTSIKNSIHHKIQRNRYFSFARYAAAAILIISASLGIYSVVNKEQSQQFLSANVKAGSKSELILPDGSKVQLNGSSKIRYNIDNSKQRVVYLSGEAYFDVARNKKLPFKVMVGDIQIEVLGTSFNVNSYSKNIIETSLFSGRIKITGNDLNSEYFLVPGEKATYNINKKRLEISKADADIDKGWCNDFLIFDSKPLSEVIEKIERWYGVDIELRCNTIANDKLSGAFRHESIENVIKSLSIQYNFKYEIEKDKIIIY